jgi:hypothetical protein
MILSSLFCNIIWDISIFSMCLYYFDTPPLFGVIPFVFQRDPKKRRYQKKIKTLLKIHLFLEILSTNEKIPAVEASRRWNKRQGNRFIASLSTLQELLSLQFEEKRWGNILEGSPGLVFTSQSLVQDIFYLPVEASRLSIQRSLDFTRFFNVMSTFSSQINSVRPLRLIIWD